MKIKTIATVNGINPVYFGDHSSRFYWLKNLGDSTLYVSAKSNMIAGGDDVSELPPKSSTSIETTAGVVYILGAGKVEIHNTDSKFCPFKSVTVVSSGGDSIKGTSFVISESVTPKSDYTADIYSWKDQTLTVSCGPATFEIPISAGFNTKKIGCADVLGSANISLTSESDIVLANTSVTESIFAQYNMVEDTAGAHLFTYGGSRQVIKQYDGKCYCAWTNMDKWFVPYLVGQNYNDVVYTMGGSLATPDSPQPGEGGSFEAYGKTWWWSRQIPNSIQNTADTSGLNRYQIRDSNGSETVLLAHMLLDICLYDIIYNS